MLDPNIPILAGKAVPDLGAVVGQGLGAYYQAQQAARQAELHPLQRDIAKAQLESQQAETAATAQYQNDLANALAGGTQGLASLAIKYPKQFDQISKNLGLISEQQKAEAADFAYKLRNTPFEQRESLINQRTAVLQSQGRDPSDTIQLLGMDQKAQDESLEIVEIAALSPEKRQEIAQNAKMPDKKSFGRVERGLTQEGEPVFFQMVGDDLKIVEGVQPEENVQKLKFEAEQAKAESAKIKAKQERQKQAFIVTQDIDRAIGMTEQFATTGFAGAAVSGIPGTPAYNLSKMLAGIKANIGFDKLQEMREASPTGGALGQVSEIELEFLQSVYGSLDQSQDEDQLKRNLNRLKAVFNSVVHGYYPIPFEQTQYDELPSGAIYIDPNDGEMRRKPSQPATIGRFTVEVVD